MQLVHTFYSSSPPSASELALEDWNTFHSTVDCGLES